MKTRIDWSFYLNRRRSNLKRFIRNRKIKSYSALCEECDGLKITRPPERLTEGMFESPKKKEAASVKSVASKSSKRGRKKKAVSKENE